MFMMPGAAQQTFDRDPTKLRTQAAQDLGLDIGDRRKVDVSALARQHNGSALRIEGQQATPVPVPGPIATIGLYRAEPVRHQLILACSGASAGSARATAAKSLMMLMLGTIKTLATLSAVKRHALLVKLISAVRDRGDRQQTGEKGIR